MPFHACLMTPAEESTAPGVCPARGNPSPTRRSWPKRLHSVKLSTATINCNRENKYWWGRDIVPHHDRNPVPLHQFNGALLILLVTWSLDWIRFNRFSRISLSRIHKFQINGTCVANINIRPISGHFRSCPHRKNSDIPSGGKGIKIHQLWLKTELNQGSTILRERRSSRRKSLMTHQITPKASQEGI